MGGLDGDDGRMHIYYTISFAEKLTAGNSLSAKDQIRRADIVTRGSKKALMSIHQPRRPLSCETIPCAAVAACRTRCRSDSIQRPVSSKIQPH